MYKADNLHSFNQNDIISTVTSTKFLAININENLIWKMYIDEISKRLDKNCFFIIRSMRGSLGFF